MKKFWWGIFFAALILVLLIAPESNFSNRVRDLFYTVQDSFVGLLDAATADPKQVLLALFSGALISIFFLYILCPWIKFEAKFTILASLGGALLLASLGLPRADPGEQASAQPSLTIAECRQCWAALPWHLAEGHVETGFGCRAASPLW